MKKKRSKNEGTHKNKKNKKRNIKIIDIILSVDTDILVLKSLISLIIYFNIEHID